MLLQKKSFPARWDGFLELFAAAVLNCHRSAVRCCETDILLELPYAVRRQSPSSFVCQGVGGSLAGRTSKSMKGTVLVLLQMTEMTLANNDFLSASRSARTSESV